MGLAVRNHTHTLGTTVPWNDFDITEKEKNLWDLTFTPEH